MKFSKTTLSIICSAILAGGGLAACSSGGGSSPYPSNGSQKATYGVITGFGSVFVNGVEYETTEAAVTVDGSGGSEDDLAIGMVVKVEGTVDSDGVHGSASSINFNDEMQGTVLGVTLTNGVVSLDVMGQTVNVDADTVFESKVAGITSIDMLAFGNIVEVSGYSDGNGTVYATRVELKKAAHSNDEEIEVKGKISNLDTTAMTFLLGDLTVDYSNANLLNFPESGIANDLFVEVTTTSDVNNNIMIAAKVEMKNAGNKYFDGNNQSDGHEMEGIVTVALDGNQFTLNDQIVIVDDATQYEDGSEMDIVLGTKMVVEGELNSDGYLVASHIKFRTEAGAQMLAPVDAVNADTNTITVMGLEIHVNTLTRMSDQQDNNMTPVRYFSLADVAQGDWVVVRYYKDAGGDYVATEVKREDPSNDAMDKLNGIIDEITDAGLLVIEGVYVDASIAGTDFTVGQQVEVTGTYADGVLTATKVDHNQ